MTPAKHSVQPRVGTVARRKIPSSGSGSRERASIAGNDAGHDTLRKLRPQKRTPAMKTKVGLWIDHRKAVIALITAQGDTISEIRSDVEHEPSRFAGVQSTVTHEALQVKSDDRLQRSFTVHIRRFYAKVIKTIADADAILILGPGEAKGELQKQLDLDPSRKRSVVVTPAAALSNRQLMARIHKYFRV